MLLEVLVLVVVYTIHVYLNEADGEDDEDWQACGNISE
jgi:hypothetical protein